MSDNGGYEYIKRPINPEAGIEIAYRVPFAWGEIAVSKAANHEYGLVPLSNTIRNGEKNELLGENSIFPSVRVEIVGANELPHPGPHDVGGFRLRILQEPKGLRLTMSSSMTKGKVSEILGETSDLLNSRPELTAILSELGADVNPPSAESIEQRAPQIIAHQFADMALHALSHATFEMMSTDRDKHLLTQIRRLGQSTVLATLAGGLTASLVSSSAPSPEPFLVTFALISTVNGTLGYRALKRHISSRRDFEMGAQSYAISLGEIVQSAIHDTYCTHRFDETHKGLLDDNNS